MSDQKLAGSPPPATPSDAEIKLRLQEERIVRLEAENREIANRMRAEEPPPASTADPLEQFATGLGLPDKTRDLLDAGTRSRAREEAVNVGKKLEQDNARRLFETESRIVHNMTFAANPDMAADKEGVAAAAGVLQYELSSKGERLPPTEYYSRLTESYRKLHPRPAPVPVPMESGGSSNLQAPVGQPAGEPTRNAYEEDYNFEPGEIKDFREGGGQRAVADTMSERYHMDKNFSLQKEGFVSNLVQVNLPIRAEKARRAAAAAAK